MKFEEPDILRSYNRVKHVIRNITQQVYEDWPEGHPARLLSFVSKDQP